MKRKAEDLVDQKNLGQRDQDKRNDDREALLNPGVGRQGVGPAQFPRLSKRACYGFFGLILLFAFVASLQLNKVFHDYYRDHWGLYTAFGANVLMAALFLSMFYNRASMAGQSAPIAVCMLLGNGSAGIAWLLYPPPEIIGSAFQVCLIAGSFILNLLYVVVLLRFSGSRRNQHIGARSLPAAGR